ncbi:hypothetical protein E5676_scaffold105G001090 [Cucumis melo var. makuwa]|uniref:Uncharacterized protein n=1 Tax=Cucumis melo var. makuwa TaxID=1194695 RepID=A0A5A7U2C5_CUCMM|nr:hypothetical protein E6C27_scaffold13G001270 [Cucumis melo var. makuwa]TYK07693.1 hypothetical protein E5676_scaffold105G001090 [Cucumis melo var. makuwa]
MILTEGSPCPEVEGRRLRWLGEQGARLGLEVLGSARLAARLGLDSRLSYGSAFGLVRLGWDSRLGLASHRRARLEIHDRWRLVVGCLANDAALFQRGRRPTEGTHDGSGTKKMKAEESTDDRLRQRRPTPLRSSEAAGVERSSLVRTMAAEKKR